MKNFLKVLKFRRNAGFFYCFFALHSCVNFARVFIRVDSVELFVVA